MVKGVAAGEGDALRAGVAEGVAGAGEAVASGVAAAGVVVDAGVAEADPLAPGLAVGVG